MFLSVVISTIRISRDYILSLGKFCPDVNSRVYLFQLTLNIRFLPILVFYNMICSNQVLKPTT